MIVANERDVQRLRLEGDSLKNVHKKVLISPQEGCEGQVMHKMGRRQFTAEFKTKIVLEILREENIEQRRGKGSCHSSYFLLFL